MSDVANNKALVLRFVDAGNERDMDALDELLTPDFKRHCPATPDVEVNCPDDFKRFLERDVAAMLD
jgi:ketosteroid isomerase-like protein